MAEVNSIQNTLNICKRCRNPAPNGISCIKCGTVSHKSCLKELQKKFKYITFIDGDKVNCCLEENCMESSLTPAITSAPESSKLSDFEHLKFNHLQEILEQKDFAIKQMELVIRNQNIAIEALKEQIDLLKTLKTVGAKVPPVEVHSNKKVVQKPNVETSVGKDVKGKAPANKAGPSSKSVITASQVSAAVHDAHAFRVCEDAVSLGNVSTNKYMKSTGRPGTKSRAILTGSMSNTVACPIKATTITPMKHFHITKLEPNTDAICLKQYLCQFVPNVEVVKLSVRNPQMYSSFKVSVMASEEQLLLNSDIWPQGVNINRFFLPRKRQEFTSLEES